MTLRFNMPEHDGRCNAAVFVFDAYRKRGASESE